MARPINTTAMTVYGVIDVGDCLIRRRRRLRSASSLFETDDAAMLVGRKGFEGLAACWPSARGHGPCPEPGAEMPSPQGKKRAAAIRMSEALLTPNGSGNGSQSPPAPDPS
jgi:hypothetical protein